MKKAPTSRIEQSRVIPAPPADVFATIADPRLHTLFTGGVATGVCRAGGRFTAWDGYISGRTIRVTPGRRIVQEWQTTEWPPGAEPSRLEWTFAKHPRGTRVALKQSGVPRSQVRAYRSGWIEYYWRPLRAFFARKK